MPRHLVPRLTPRRLGFMLAAALLATLPATWMLTAAPLEGPARSDRQVALVVSHLMRKDHLSKHPLDDEISRRAMKLFIESFDPRKLYFTQIDMNEFAAKREQLDDEVRRGSVDFAYVVFRRFTERLDQRVGWVEEFVNQSFDYSVEEELVIDADNMDYAKDEAEAKDRWRKLIKYNLLTYRADGDDEAEAKQKILRRYHTLQKRWRQTDSDELLERFLTSVTSSFDPHTTYMSPSNLDNFQILMRLNLDGIGAALQMSEEGYTKISKVIPGGAADKHGKLKEDDRVVSVGQGENGEMVDVVDMKLNDVVQLIRGPAGSVVRIGVIPVGSTETKIYNITRAKIELEDSAARSVVLERGRDTDGSPYKIGVIDLPSFYMDMQAARENEGQGAFRSTTRDVGRILGEFKTQGVDTVVLDLRRNGGGSLTEAINLTGLFIDRGPVVQVKDSDGKVQAYDDLDRGMAWDGPLVVLTSKFSASASEILAGAIQDYGRGLIIGDEATHGKGTVQSLLDLGSQLFQIPNPPNLGALKITMQQFYRPNGDSTQKRGVVPDIVLPSITNLIGTGEADLDYAIEFDRVTPAQFTAYGMVNAAMEQRLAEQSKKRVGESAEFAKQQAQIDRYQTLKQEKQVPLNEQKYLARREAEREAEKEEEKQFEDQLNAPNDVFPDNFYNREVLAIVTDYLQVLAGQKVASAN